MKKDQYLKKLIWKIKILQLHLSYNQKTKMEKKIHCKSCGSTNVRMTDYQLLAINEDLLTLGQFDNELYGQFDCFDCETSFQQVLEISIK